MDISGSEVNAGTDNGQSVVEGSRGPLIGGHADTATTVNLPLCLGGEDVVALAVVVVMCRRKDTSFVQERNTAPQGVYFTFGLDLS